MRHAAEKKRKLLYFALAAVIAIVVLGWLGKVRILSAVLRSADPAAQVNQALDVIVTGLMLMGGADGLAQILKLPGSPAASEKAQTAPIQVVGTLRIEGKEESLTVTPPAAAQPERIPVAGP